MPEPIAPPAPAQAVAPTISATMDAAHKGSFDAFDKADVAQRQGKPLAEVAVAPAAPVAAPVADPVDPAVPVEPAPPSRRAAKLQQETNDRIRVAVDLATADLQAENARLKAAAAPRRVAPIAPVVPPEPKTPEWKRLADLPGAPKLADFESVEEHTAATAFFIAKTLRDEERTAGERQQQDADRTRTQQEQDTRNRAHWTAAAAADPELSSKLPAEVMAATPIRFFAPDGHGGLVDPISGQPATFAHVIADVAYESAHPSDLLKHIHAHPEERAQIAHLPCDQWKPALLRLDGRLGGTAPPPTALPVPAAIVSPPAPGPSPITAAPPPPPTLSKAGSTTDPKAAALARGDFATFDQLDVQERRARVAHA